MIALAVSEWIFTQPTVVRPDGSLVPVVEQYGTLVEHLRRTLLALGLRRRDEKIADLGAFIARRDRERAPKV